MDWKAHANNITVNENLTKIKSQFNHLYCELRYYDGSPGIKVNETLKATKHAKKYLKNQHNTSAETINSLENNVGVICVTLFWLLNGSACIFLKFGAPPLNDLNGWGKIVIDELLKDCDTYNYKNWIGFFMLATMKRMAKR
jgi:hypothetical protein